MRTACEKHSPFSQWRSKICATFHFCLMLSCSIENHSLRTRSPRLCAIATDGRCSHLTAASLERLLLPFLVKQPSSAVHTLCNLGKLIIHDKFQEVQKSLDTGLSRDRLTQPEHRRSSPAWLPKFYILLS